MKSTNYIRLSVFILLTALLSACAVGGSSNSSKYIFYLHGSVEEEEGSTEKYEMAVEALGQGSAQVISKVRDATDPLEYAEKIEAQVADLIGKGVVPGNITIAGFSKGAIITLAASTRIQNPDVNYVLLAGCSDFLNKKYGVNPDRAAGRILSIYDRDDHKFGSCAEAFDQATKITFKEVQLNSGKGHKLFRIPKEKFIHQWRDPLLEWAGA